MERKKEMKCEDLKVLEKIKDISERGNSAEVKKDRNGKYVIYEVKKRRTLVE